MAGNRVISAILTLKDRDFSSNAKKSGSAMSDLERRTKHTGNAITRFGKSAVSSLKKVALGAGSLIAAIGIVKGLSMAFGMVKSSISSALDRIDVMESFERVMTTLTGSTEKTAAALEATREAVTGTAYGLDTAAKGVKDFVTRGMEVERATDTMAAWGDAVAFYGDGSDEQLSSVADALAKMTSSGKVSMMRMNTLYNAGIDGVGMYAKATGRDVASVQKDLSKSNITADQFIDTVSKAMMEGTNGVTNIAGAAKKAGASWSGSFANMRAAVTRGVESIIVGIDKMLQDKGLPDMRAMVAIFGKKFEEVIKSVSSKIPLIATVLEKVHKKIKPGLDWLKDIAFPKIKDAVVLMGTGILVVRDWAVEAFQRIKERIQANSPVIEGVRGVMQDLGDKALELKVWMLQAFESAKPALSWLKDEGLPMVVDGIASVIEKATDVYNYINDNWNLISPIVYGVGSAILFYKGTMLLAAGISGILTGAIIAMSVAQAAFNFVLGISPLGWVAIAIGAVVAVGVLLYKNWDTIKAAGQSLWDKLKEVWTGVQTGFSNAWSAVKSAAGESLNFIIEKINTMIGVINKIPGVKIPIVAQVEWGQAEAPKGMAGLKGIDSYAVGTNRVKRDMPANIHKDEMIIPAAQSKNLRKQGVTIDNVDKPRALATASSSTSSSKNNIIININAQDRSVKDIANELVPLLQMRLANI